MNSSTAHFLVGRIHHIVSSKNNAFANKRPCNKRPRPWEAGITNSPQCDSISDANKDDRRLKGFILECEESSQKLSFHSAFGILFHLVIPLPLIKDACYAATTGKIVRISQYSLIRYRHDGRGELVFDSRDSKIVDYEKEYSTEQESGLGARNIIVAEVHCGGLSIHASDTGDETGSIRTLPHTKRHEKPTLPPMTLGMLSFRKQSHSSTRKGSKRNSLSKKEPMNITAVVDAISPILVDDSFGQPFALMELYQPDSAPVYSAVAVLRGENVLKMHPAILPGQLITLMGVISRSWKVPDTFRQSSTTSNVPEKNNGTGKFYQRLYQRTPDRVILIEESHSIHLNDESHVEVPPLPSTVESLTSIQGVVDSIHFYRHEDTHSKKTEENIHFVNIKNITQQCTFHDSREDSWESISYDSDGNQFQSQPNVATINLLKYSFAQHILLGLQPGAVIRAVNVHRIYSPNNAESCYVGCLRSTLIIERCAGDSSDCPNGPWFLSSAMPFVILPQHRIAEISTEPCKSVPSSQYIEEESLRMKVKSIIGDSASVTQQIRILLAHHHNIGTANHNARSAHKKTTPMRDPYAEFFDHAHPDNDRVNIECGSFAHKNFTTFRFEGIASSALNVPNVVRLNVLRDTCAQNFIRKMANFHHIQCGRSRVSSGWTSSHHYYSSRVYVWGKVEFDRNKPEHRGSVGVVYGDTCKIPFTVAFERNKSIAVEYKDFLGWLQVKSVLVSCLCLGRGILQDGSETANNDASRQRDTSLPHTFLPSAMAEDSILGHVFIFSVGSSIFIGSIHFIVIPVRPELAQSPSKATSPFEESTLSIQRCLEQTGEVKESSASIIGRLIRQRFHFRKVKLAPDRCTECYEGWTICLSNIDHFQEDMLSTSSMLQTIDVHVSVSVGTRRSSKTDSTKADFMKNAMQTALTDLVVSGASGTNDGANRAGPLCRVSSDQLTMALAFWHTSERNEIQPVLSGGWESCNNRLLAENKMSSTYQSFSVYVTIPLTSRVISKLGYQRFRCNLEDLRSFTVLETFNIAKSSCSDSSQFLDFSVNLDKFLPGMLMRRLCRVKPFTNAKGGKVIKNPYTALTTLTDGVQSATLADLHWDVCKVLSERQPSRLNPSLLRRICKAKVLGINFCRAQVECTQCFQFLVSSRSEDGTLLCPTGCRSEHAAVKWECSALIDDGTGQAKLYAEREAALLLLGSSLDVAAVEEGAWMCQDGVFFQPSLPPSSYLRRSIKDASMEARKLNTQKRQDTDAERHGKGETALTYDFLTPLAKAEYLLQYHCRQWYQKHHHFKLDLFCRCKPLSVDVTTVNRTEIQVAKAIDGFGLDFGTAQTTSLPPLKLILEDIAVASDDNQDDRWTAWNMLREFKSSEARSMI
ncbi:hypothetical protein ACHAW6_011825 [Cyclotella cf. meneghiniana]